MSCKGSLTLLSVCEMIEVKIYQYAFFLTFFTCVNQVTLKVRDANNNIIYT